MFLSELLWGIDTDETDGNLLAICDNCDGVAVGDSGTFELTGKGNSRQDDNGYDDYSGLKGSGGHQDAFQALLQMIRLMVEGVTPYFSASWS